jgi:uncharacterized membrane protein (DUF485 family)
VGYFVIISYASLAQQGTFRDMRKSYQFSLIMTLFVILSFLTLLFIESYHASELAESNTVYVAFVSLVNVYMWTISYLYSPAVDSLEDIQFKEARREHESIMN